MSIKINKNMLIEDTGVNFKQVADDTIIEQGSNANGSYIKYADGRMECWNTVTKSVEITTATGNIFYATAVQFNFPVPFTDIPEFYDASVSNSGYPWVSGVNATARGIAVKICCGTSVTRDTIIRYKAWGRWKAKENS